MQLLKHGSESPGSAAECAALLTEVMPLIMRALRAEMRSHRADLSVPHFRALAFLSHHEGSPLSDVAEWVGLTMPAASRLVDVLVARGLVTRAESPRDRRCVVLALTPEGQALLEAARAATQARLAEKTAALSEREREVVAEAMRLLRPLFGGE